MGTAIQTYSTFEASAFIASVGANSPICQIAPRQVNSDKPCDMGLLLLRVVLATAVQTQFGLLRAASAGTPTGPGTFTGLGASSGNGGYTGGTGPGQLLTLWSAAPTVSGSPAYFEQDLLPNTVGAGFEWRYPEDDPFTTAMTRSTSAHDAGLLLWNLNAGASADLIVTVRWMEFNPLAP